MGSSSTNKLGINQFKSGGGCFPWHWSPASAVSGSRSGGNSGRTAKCRHTRNNEVSKTFSRTNVSEHGSGKVPDGSTMCKTMRKWQNIAPFRPLRSWFSKRHRLFSDSTDLKTHHPHWKYRRPWSEHNEKRERASGTSNSWRRHNLARAMFIINARGWRERPAMEKQDWHKAPHLLVTKMPGVLTTACVLAVCRTIHLDPLQTPSPAWLVLCVVRTREAERSDVQYIGTVFIMPKKKKSTDLAPGSFTGALLFVFVPPYNSTKVSSLMSPVRFCVPNWSCRLFVAVRVCLHQLMPKPVYFKLDGLWLMPFRH